MFDSSKIKWEIRYNLKRKLTQYKTAKKTPPKVKNAVHKHKTKIKLVSEARLLTLISTPNLTSNFSFICPCLVVMIIVIIMGKVNRIGVISGFAYMCWNDT